MDMKKAYYYVICLAASLVFAWGAIDLSSAAVGLITDRSGNAALEQALPSSSEREGESMLESYYQKKILYDKLTDSLARLVVAGLIFAYSRAQAARLEK